MRKTGTPCYKVMGVGRRKSVDLAIQTSICAGRASKQHSRSSRQYDKGIGMRAGDGCAIGMTVGARAGETLSANRLNGSFQSRLCSPIYDS